MSEVKFLVFSDLHYKKKMYATTVEDLEIIMARAKEENVDFVIHEGDFCNDYCRSPEIIKVYHGSGLPVFGVYGNHELETPGNTMQVVTPCLTNAPENVIWGTSDGKIGDGSIAYYHFDRDDFRFIFIDANYSLMPDGVTYEHNREGSWTKPKENTHVESLGDAQLKWLEGLLMDAAEKGMRCIVNAHPTFSGIWQRSTCDDIKVRALYAAANAKRKGTVLLSINGHYHTNRRAVIEDVLYLDINVVRNGWWQPEKFYPYEEDLTRNPKFTFDYTDYDKNGNALTTEKQPLSMISMSAQTLFFKDPLSAIVTVTSDGKVTVKGSETEWMYGIVKDSFPDGIMPKISDYKNY